MAFIRIPHQRATARWSNNALAIASLKVYEIRRPGGGWAPSVLIQGKVHTFLKAHCVLARNF